MKLPKPAVARFPATAAAALVLWLPVPTHAQSAKDILMTALDRYEERMEGIENYTVIEEAMGFESSLTFERSEVEGRTVFLPADDDGAAGGMANFYRVYPKIAERAELRGQESVDGQDCYVVAIDDFSGLDLADEMAMGEQNDFAPKRGKLYVDADDYLVRKMEMEGEITSQGETRPVTAETLLLDYRNVEGMLHPFQLRIVATGVTPGMSEEEMEQARKSLEEMEKNLEGMDASQRAMVERMMGPQMEKLREMIATGRFELTVNTKELRVNEQLQE